jgi:ribosomal protein L12E/L44/L45/RPP1/RPP2
MMVGDALVTHLDDKKIKELFGKVKTKSTSSSKAGPKSEGSQ